MRIWYTALVSLPRGTSGADPEVEEGWGGTHSGVGAAMRLAQRAAFFLCERITQIVPGGSGGMLP